MRATSRNLAWARVSPAACAASSLTATSWRAASISGPPYPAGTPGPDRLDQPESAPHDRCLP